MEFMDAAALCSSTRDEVVDRVVLASGKASLYHSDSFSTTAGHSTSRGSDSRHSSRNSLGEGHLVVGPSLPAALLTGKTRRLHNDGALSAESDEGDVEYKWRLTHISDTRFQHLVTQMKYRVAEGNGQCLYEIGIRDNGDPQGLDADEYAESIATVRRMASSLRFSADILFERVVQTTPEVLMCCEILVSEALHHSPDLRIAFCGSSGVGKSTLVGVLITGTLDDGTGCVRQAVFNHKHEVDSGKTSSLSSRTVAFDDAMLERSPFLFAESTRCDCCSDAHCDDAGGKGSAESQGCDGAVLAVLHGPGPRAAASQSISPLQGVATLIDVGGDVTKTAVFGLTSRAPEYVCVCVDASRPVRLAVKFAELCLAMNIPFFVVVTKVDLLDELELDEFLYDLIDVLSRLSLTNVFVVSGDGSQESLPDQARDTHDRGGAANVVQRAAQQCSTGCCAPIFCVSTVSGEGVAAVRLFMRALPVRRIPAEQEDGFEVLLDDCYPVDGVGDVVSGYVACGRVLVGTHCFVGPDSSGLFHPVVIRGIHVGGSHVMATSCKTEATLAIGQLPPAIDLSQKGKILCSSKRQVCWVFDVTVKVLSQTPPVCNLEPILHTRNVRQAVKIVATSSAEGAMKHREEGLIRCRFLFRPEVLGLSDTVVLRWSPDGVMVGTVVAIREISPALRPLDAPFFSCPAAAADLL